MDENLFFNGVQAETGDYATAPATLGQLAALARDASGDLKAPRSRGVRRGDPRRLDQVGWGIVFAASEEKTRTEAILRELKPLLDHREEQVSRHGERRCRLFLGEDGYQQGESAEGFLERHDAGLGAADPDRLPYYLLLVGDPGAIPWEFQYQLDLHYAVGRICFDTPEEHGRYARGVCEAEEAKRGKASGRAAFFAPRHPDDPPTDLSLDELATPLAARLARRSPGWQVETAFGDDATKGRLGRLLDGGSPPDLLFTAGHGMVFFPDSPRLLARQGALLCREWPGRGQGPISPDQYFCAEDLQDSASARGLISFHFGCYTAGGPARDEYSLEREPAPVAPRAFVSRLPQRLLAHPNGSALAVIGHVEKTFEGSIAWSGAKRHIEAFEDMLDRLLDGYPVGSAMEPFAQRYAEAAVHLCGELVDLRRGKKEDESRLARLWTASHDSRNYIVLGDPAVRLADPEGLA